MSLLVAPDPGEMFRVWAIAQPEVAAIFSDRVSDTLDTDSAAVRYLVLPGGGSHQLWEPQLQVECWSARGDDDADASYGARTISALIDDRPPHGAIADLDGYVVGASVEVQPYSAADRDTRRQRHILQIRLLTGPL